MSGMEYTHFDVSFVILYTSLTFMIIYSYEVMNCTETLSFVFCYT